MTSLCDVCEGATLFTAGPLGESGVEAILELLCSDVEAELVEFVLTLWGNDDVAVNTLLETSGAEETEVVLKSFPDSDIEASL